MTKRSSLVDQVVDQILELIQSDQLEVGKKLLSERELMQICGAGRSTVRESAPGCFKPRVMWSSGPTRAPIFPANSRTNQRALSWIAEHSNEMRDVLEVRWRWRGWPRAWPPSAPPIRKSICWWASKP